MARVLLVEDEITVLIVAESVVQGLGHSTYSAGSVVQAVALVALLDDPGEIDLLFTDIRLPEGNLGGFELAEQARGKNPKPEGALHHRRYDNRRHEGAGGEMLPKPYTAPELAAAIKRLLPAVKPPTAGTQCIRKASVCF
jgi:CheY-like chemotaxis protein